MPLGAINPLPLSPSPDFTGMTICRMIAENKESMELKNSKSTFCSKLHGLSTSEKNLFSAVLVPRYTSYKVDDSEKM